MTSGGIVSGYSSRVRVSTGPPPEEPRSGDTPPAAAKAGRGRVRTGSSTGRAESAAPRAATDSGSLGVSAGSSSAGPTLLRTSGIRDPPPMSTTASMGTCAPIITSRANSIDRSTSSVIRSS